MQKKFELLLLMTVNCDLGMNTPKSGQEDSTPPLPKKGRGRVRMQVLHSPSALISPVAVAPKKSRRQLYLKNPLFDHQAKETNSAGVSQSSDPNSSDDENESDLSFISHGLDHENAERHVYLEAQSSQTNFPTPIRNQRSSHEGRVPLAGDICMRYSLICELAHFDIPQI